MYFSHPDLIFRILNLSHSETEERRGDLKISGFFPWKNDEWWLWGGPAKKTSERWRTHTAKGTDTREGNERTGFYFLLFLAFGYPPVEGTVRTIVD